MKKLERIVWIFLLAFVISAAGQSSACCDQDLLYKHQNALLQAVGIDMGIWAWDRYVAQRTWAMIDFNSIRRNIEEGWVYDDNSFQGNQLGHPYHGSLVFTAARSEGLSFWESVPYPVVSSLLWEVALETPNPSINDMMTTPLSGITLGEVLHRMSLVILGENPTFKNEFSTFLLNPMYGFKRLLKGYPRPGLPEGGAIRYTAGISLGGGGYFLDKHNEMLQKQFLRFHIYYGDPFSSRHTRNPFDYFTFIWILNFEQGDFVGEIFAEGLLKMIDTRNRNDHSYSFGIYKNYDYMNHDEFKISSSSVGMGFIHEFRTEDRDRIHGEFFLDGIVFGGSGGDSVDVTNREYYYGPGFSAKLLLKYDYKNKITLYSRFKRYLLFNIEDLRLNHYENINLLKLGIQYHLWQRISLGGEYTLTSRKPVGSIVRDQLQSRDILRLNMIYRLNPD